MDDKEQRIKIEFETNADETAKKVRALKESEEDLKNANEALAQSYDKTSAGVKIIDNRITEAKKAVNENTAALKNNQKGIAEVQKETLKATTSTENLTDKVTKNGGALAILDSFTGGLATSFKDAYEASDLFSGGMGKMLKSVKTFSTGAKAALISTGIGALVVLVGILVSYWDDLKGLVSGVNGEMVKQGKIAEENAKTEQDKLDTLNGQDNILKSQGKSEKEILQIKQKQTAETITALEAQLESQKTIADAQLKASKRNRDILSGILKFVSAPITLLLGAIDLAGKAFGKDFNLLGKFDNVAELLFDPKQVREEGQKSLDETNKKLNSLKNTQAGYQNSIKDIDKKALEEKKAKQKEAYDKELERLKEQAEKKKALLKEQNDYEQNLLKGNQDLNDKTEEEKLARQKERATEEIKALKAKGIDVTNITRLNAEKYATLEQELADKRKSEQVKSYNADLEAIIANKDIDLEIRKSAIEEEQSLLQGQFDAKILSEEEFNAKQKLLADARKEIADKEVEEQKKRDDAKLQLAQTLEDAKVAITDKALNLFGLLAGKNKKIQKALIVAEGAIGLARTIRSTAEANTAALASATIAVGVGGPAAIAAYAAPTITANNLSGALSGATIIAQTGLALKALGGGGGGLSSSGSSSGSALPNGGTSAAPQVQFQGSNENQIGNALANNVNNQVIEAFVVESSVTNAQQLANNRITSNSI